MPLTDGAMQPFGLTVDRFIDHAARWHPAAEVVSARGEGPSARIGYAALRARARKVSAVLAGLGVAPGARVATLAWNSQAHVECWYGIMGMGAACHTLNPRLTATQLAWMLERSGAAILIVSADLAPLAADVAGQSPGVTHVLVIDGDTADLAARLPSRRVEPLEARLAIAGEPPAWGEVDELAPCGLCFTSGTTGDPKGVTYTHRGVFLHTLRQLQASVTGITERDSVLTVVPMFHANAWGMPFAVPAVGGKLVLPGRHSDGPSLALLIDEEQVTIAVGVPTVWSMLFDHLDSTGGALPSLKRIMVGGAPMPAALMERIERRGTEVQTTWGMTELSPLGTATPPGADRRSPGKSGRTAIGLDLMISDHDGTPWPEQRGAEGKLWVRGPAVVDRYLGQAEPVTVDGWFDTGDLAIIDHDGSLRITGRSKDLIKSGGEWINPAEIEALVAALPEVAAAAVIGRSDPKWGERPVLIVELRDGAELDDEGLLAPLHGKVATWWVPDAIVRVPAIPLAATGKIDKLRLRGEYSRAGAGEPAAGGARQTKGAGLAASKQA